MLSLLEACFSFLARSLHMQVPCFSTNHAKLNWHEKKLPCMAMGAHVCMGVYVGALLTFARVVGIHGVRECQVFTKVRPCAMM